MDAAWKNRQRAMRNGCVAAVALALALLSACTTTTPTRQPTAMATPHGDAEVTASLPNESGADVLRHLRSRYADTVRDCNGSATAPAFVCSGILLRATRFATGGRYSWMPNPTTAGEGVSFSWLRRDSNFYNPFPASNGFIFFPKTYADKYGATKIYVRCSYPYDAWTGGTDRCTMHDHNGNITTTPLCHKDNPSITTAAQWMQKYNDDENQCAFSTVGEAGFNATAAAFMASIDVRTGMGLRNRGELVVDSWLSSDPKSAPVEAFFYQVPVFDPTYQDPLTNAKEDQKIYYGLTGRWVPLIRWNLTRNGDQTFDYIENDQGMAQPGSPNPSPSPGQDVARHLQSRFDDVSARDCHAGVPAFVCSGVLIRGTDFSSAFHSWIPNPNDSQGGVSASWLRQDSNFPQTYKSNGFIVLPRDFSDSSQFDNINVRCVYIVNASTAGRADKCSGNCQSLGVTTSAQYIAKFGNTAGCGFLVEKGVVGSDQAWMAAVAVRQNYGLFTWNEVILQDWTSSPHQRIPLEAFFYIAGKPAGLANAQGDQQDFKLAGGRWVPVIQWTPATSAGGPSTFTYNDADQAITQ